MKVSIGTQYKFKKIIVKRDGKPYRSEMRIVQVIKGLR